LIKWAAYLILHGTGELANKTAQRAVGVKVARGFAVGGVVEDACAEGCCADMVTVRRGGGGADARARKGGGEGWVAAWAARGLVKG
jgi:hypothetical protein